MRKQYVSSNPYCQGRTVAGRRGGRSTGATRGGKKGRKLGRSWESKAWEARGQDPPCPKDLIQNNGVHRGVLDEYFTALFNNTRTLKFKGQPTFAQLHSQNTEVYFSVFKSLWFLAFDWQFSTHFLCSCVSTLVASSPRLALLAKCRVHLVQLTKRLLCSLEGQLLVIVITCMIDSTVGTEKRNCKLAFKFRSSRFIEQRRNFCKYFFFFPWV